MEEIKRALISIAEIMMKDKLKQIECRKPKIDEDCKMLCNTLQYMKCKQTVDDIDQLKIIIDDVWNIEGVQRDE